ncbi:MAG: aminoacyl-tRNA hydrolase [Flavobacteriales bacterium]|nr:aminoacyl-tRNA hydrolase [Flavobacteriales bacterium]MCB9167066.1 aminoacyl-tRNA hydrolase [Flavobacteriales bacterium]
MKYLVVGLGNPGAEYADTRHNIGFHVVQALADQGHVGSATERYGEHAEMRIKGRTLVLIQPSTFMNLSGNAVRYWMEREKVPLERLLVVTDDLALPFGRLRLRATGGAGGHNGLAHIIQVLGTEAFARLRFGIGADFTQGGQVRYVLDTWRAEEKKELEDRVGAAVRAVEDFVLLGIERAMNLHNVR